MNKVYIVYVAAGYKIDDGHGHFMFGGRAWNSLDDAKRFADEENLNYEVV